MNAFPIRAIIRSMLIPLLLTSCAPVYKTFYDFTPPKSRDGKRCVNDCQQTLQQCEGNEHQRHESCKTRSRLAYEACQSRAVYAWDYKDEEMECVANCYCFEESCPEPDLELCNERHRVCYENCGGRVSSYTRCVSNCDQAPAPDNRD